MRTVKWCLMFGVVLAGVVIGYCRPCHEEGSAPLPMSFDCHYCDEGCECCGRECDPNQAFGVDPSQLGEALPPPGFYRDGGSYFPKGTDFPLSQELNAIQAADAERAEKVVR